MTINGVSNGASSRPALDLTVLGLNSGTSMVSRDGIIARMGDSQTYRMELTALCATSGRRLPSLPCISSFSRYVDSVLNYDSQSEGDTDTATF